MPATARPGDIIEIKALIRHPMETGYRVDARGQPIPRHIVRRFAAVYGGTEIFRMEMTQGVAANPFIAFHTVATETGEIVFVWEDDLGATTEVRKTIEVV